MKPIAESYFGFVDKFELVDGYYQFIFDSFPVTEFERIRGPRSDSPFEDFVTAIIDLRIRSSDIRKVFNVFNQANIESRWARITIASSNTGLVANQYKEDASDYSEIRIERIEFLDARKKADKKELADLRRLFLLTSLAKKDKSQLSGLDSRFEKADVSFVSVYDVGQGNANAVCSRNSKPLMYYNLGGGCLRNAHTYRNLKRFCTTKKPVVVLSHWDLDHRANAKSVDSRLLLLKQLPARFHPSLEAALPMNGCPIE